MLHSAVRGALQSFHSAQSVDADMTGEWRRLYREQARWRARVALRELARYYGAASPAGPPGDLVHLVLFLYHIVCGSEEVMHA